MNYCSIPYISQVRFFYSPVVKKKRQKCLSKCEGCQVQKLFLISRGESLYSYQSGDLSLFIFPLCGRIMVEKFRSKGCKGGFFRAPSAGLHREYNAAWLSRVEWERNGEWTSSECECVYATLLTTWRFSPFHPFHDQIYIKREEVTRGYMCGVYVCAYNIHWSTAATLIKGFTQSWKGAAAEL